MGALHSCVLQRFKRSMAVDCGGGSLGMATLVFRATEFVPTSTRARPVMLPAAGQTSKS